VLWIFAMGIAAALPSNSHVSQVVINVGHKDLPHVVCDGATVYVGNRPAYVPPASVPGKHEFRCPPELGIGRFSLSCDKRSGHWVNLVDTCASSSNTASHFGAPTTTLDHAYDPINVITSASPSPSPSNTTVPQSSALSTPELSHLNQPTLELEQAVSPVVSDTPASNLAPSNENSANVGANTVSPSTNLKVVEIGTKQRSSNVGRLLIGVETAPAHFDARQAIRQTWAKYLDTTNPSVNRRWIEEMDLRFFVGEISGKPSETESRLAVEPWLVRLDGFVESYGNLSAKTLGIISWASDMGYSHLMKVDDDVFLQLDLIDSFLKSTPGLDATYAGEFANGAAPVSNPASKWYMSDQYTQAVFPDYAFGSAYFIGRRIIDYVGQHRRSLKLYRVEDAGLAIWLESSGLRVERVPMENMYFQAECWDAYAVFVTPINAKEMYVLQNNKEMQGNLCGATYAFVPLECLERRCRCYPLPDTGACESDMANEAYRDLIPRLL